MAYLTNEFTVAVLPLDGYAALSLAACTEPLRAANLILGRPYYKILPLSTDGDAVPSSGFTASIASAPYLELSQSCDLVMVVAGGDPAKFDQPPLMTWLRQRAAQGTALAGVSGGPLILARAGVMRGYRMTIHWEHATLLDELRPSLLLERSLFVIDRNRYTCAGGTAALDMMLALIARHHGQNLARQVSDWFMHTAIRSGSDPQRSGLAERLGCNNAAVLQAVDAMDNHIADPLSLKQVAALSDCSARQLNRLFQNHLQQSTMSYYRELRLQTAQKLLQQSGLSVAEISAATGFSSAAHFCARFADQFGLSPQSYRQSAHLEATAP